MGLYLIAEIGINHNGDMGLAKQMIAAASDAGFDAVKFQKRTIEAVYTNEYLDSSRESPWGNTQRQQKEGLEFSLEQYQEINDYCQGLHIDWFASAWDVQAQKDMRRFNSKYNKVASAMLGNKPLLLAIAEEKKKTFISTGMATIDEIDSVVELFKSEACSFELMHCNSTYPMLEKDANLNCITTLRERYDCEVGYSGHESSLIKVCVAAVALGATSIERHITIDRAMYGSDQSASIETHALRNFVESVRAIPETLGDGQKNISDAELAVRKKLRVEVFECEKIS
ncbi:MAG: N-acetylneuraminate synthase family protein [Coxiellaceae bacterium]|nr:N-acetylneuraminate synthase family protein [Coxiellaceae bacterium]MDF1865538.1 N-acetylneuraminate synthase family protein [Saprospiraceae bacterium]